MFEAAYKQGLIDGLKTAGRVDLEKAEQLFELLKDELMPEPEPNPIALALSGTPVDALTAALPADLSGIGSVINAAVANILAMQPRAAQGPRIAGAAPLAPIGGEQAPKSMV